MPSNIDHIIWACPDLDAGIAEFETMTGVRAQAGGKHPHLGTHNALMHLGGRSYFEIVAPDPDHDGGPWSRSLQQLSEPTLLHWVIARPNLGDYVNGLSGLVGADNGVTSISRHHPKLGLLNWEILLLPRHEFGCLIPFLIDWGESTHPTELLEHECTLRSVRITSPQLADLMKVYSWLAIDVEFAEAANPKLEFLIDTPNGEVNLATSLPLPAGVTFDS
jgi:hypothetical protein